MSFFLFSSFALVYGLLLAMFWNQFRCMEKKTIVSGAKGSISWRMGIFHFVFSFSFWIFQAGHLIRPVLIQQSTTRRPKEIIRNPKKYLVLERTKDLFVSRSVMLMFSTLSFCCYSLIAFYFSQMLKEKKGQENNNNNKKKKAKLIEGLHISIIK